MKIDIDTVDIPINSHVKSWCSIDFVLDGVRLVGGLYSGTYRTIGHVDDMKDCMKACCDEEECTVAYLERGTCYAVKCLDKGLCKSTMSDSKTSVGYIVRDGKGLFRSAQEAVTGLVLKQADTVHKEGADHVLSGEAKSANATKPEKPPNHQTLNTTKAPLHFPEEPKPETSHGLDFGYCEKGETLRNKRLMGGMKAGVFRDHGDVDDMETCSEYCCRDKDCHLAYMIDKTCYSVRCYNSELCKTFTAPNFFLNPVMSFVSRSRNVTGINTLATILCP